MGAAATALAIWAAIEFIDSETVRDQLRWGGLCLLGMLMSSFIEVYFWMEMRTNRILREAKRVELLFLQRIK